MLISNNRVVACRARRIDELQFLVELSFQRVAAQLGSAAPANATSAPSHHSAAAARVSTTAYRGQLEKLATARRICGASCVQTAGSAAATTTAVPRKPLTMQAISLYRAPVVVA